MAEDDDLEARVEAALAASGAGGEASGPLTSLLAELLERCREQQRLLERLVRISDQAQRAERERGLSYIERYRKKVQQIEKIVRISDQYQAMLRDLNDRLARASSVDHLTGLTNRRRMQELLEREHGRAARNVDICSIALADVDHFKHINDSFGHAVGDAALVHVAESLGRAIREQDVCARWGGEEFLILFPGLELEAVVVAAERIRCAIPPCPTLPADLSTITVSIGVATYRAGDTLDGTIHRADLALYRAKQEGRNRVVVEDIRSY